MIRAQTGTFRGMQRWRAVGAALLVAMAVAPTTAGTPAPTRPQPIPISAPLRAPTPPPAPPQAPQAVQDALDAVAEAYGEPVGIAVADLDAGWTAEVRGEDVFPQQSVSKLWVALAMLDAVDRGERRLDEVVVMRPEDRSVFFQPISGMIRDGGYATTVGDLISRALSQSDNAANDKLIREAGGIAAVKAALGRKGLANLKVGAEERELQAGIAGLVWRPDYGVGWNFQAARAALPEATRDAALAAYLSDPADGVTPLAVVNGLAKIHRGEVLSPASRTVMLDAMTRARTGPKRLKGGLPPGWSLAHKTGTGQDWRGASVGINDVGLITAPDGRTYAVAVMIRRTFRPVPERLEMMQSVSRAIVMSWTQETSAPVLTTADLGGEP